jgi:hypothetical protein
MNKWALIALLFLFTACTSDEEPELKDAVDLVPADNEISGWARGGSMDIAENETQLLALINGEGQVFIDNGFVKFVRQRYQGTVSGNQRELEVRIVDMGSAHTAETVYDETGFGSETPWTEDGHAGTEARIEEGFISDYMIDFWEDRFYVRVTLFNEKTVAGLNIAKLFAINISEAIGE